MDPDDEDQLEEMLDAAGDYGLAGHIVRNSSEAELTKFLADSWALLRLLAEHVADAAMILRTVPTEEMAKGMAEALEEHSRIALRVVPRAASREDA